MKLVSTAAAAASVVVVESNLLYLNHEFDLMLTSRLPKLQILPTAIYD